MKIDKLINFTSAAAGSTNTSLGAGHLNGLIIGCTVPALQSLTVRIRGAKNEVLVNNIDFDKLSVIGDFMGNVSARFDNVFNKLVEASTDKANIKLVFPGAGVVASEDQLFSFMLPLGSITLLAGDEIVVDVNHSGACTSVVYAISTDETELYNVIKYDSYVDSAASLRNCAALFGFTSDITKREEIDISITAPTGNYYSDFLGCSILAAVVGNIEAAIYPDFALLFRSDIYVEDINYKLGGSSAGTVTLVSVSKDSYNSRVQLAENMQIQKRAFAVRQMAAKFPAIHAIAVKRKVAL